MTKSSRNDFFHTYKFSNHDSNKFILFLQKSVYPYDYMDDWEMFDETSLPEKIFLQSLNYGRFYWSKLHPRKKSLQKFWKKIYGEYYDLYVQSNTLLLTDVFENFRDMFLEIYDLDRTKFLPASGLSLQAALRKTKKKN